MSDVSWWLMLLSFVLGAVITWLWVVRRATRRVAHVVRSERHVATAAPVGRVHHDADAEEEFEDEESARRAGSTRWDERHG
ncbi:hypothetical protein ACOCJ4_14245 [Knoellia sp. CPCC 206435]|uniref:channel accessory protein ArfC n=1 Tax=Knoellia terrae TaxID=3404797 RepID=UPI003B42F2B6